MTPTPAEASQEEIAVVRNAIHATFGWLSADQTESEARDAISKAAIAALDQYRQEHGIVPGYMEFFSLGYEEYHGGRFNLYRFKTEGADK